MFLYKCFGLVLASEFEMSSLTPVKRLSADVSVALKPEMDTNIDICSNVHGFLIGPSKEVLMELDFGWILVENGTKIKIRLKTDLALQEAIQYVLGSGMGIILQQRQTLALHASAISIGGKAVLFLGRSGSGKSSTAYSFVRKGHALISDDISAIYFNQEKPMVHHGLPRQKIAEDVLESLKESIAPTEDPIDENRLKYIREIQAFEAQVYPLHQIFFIKQGQTDRPYLRNSEQFEVFKKLIANTYRYGLVKPLGFQERHLEICAQVYNSTDIKTIILPKNILSLDATYELIKSQIALSV